MKENKTTEKEILETLLQDEEIKKCYREQQEEMKYDLKMNGGY